VAKDVEEIDPAEEGGQEHPDQPSNKDV
jgi:hypothetical protein